MGEHLFTFKLDIKLPWFINSDIVWSKYYIKTIQTYTEYKRVKTNNLSIQVCKSIPKVILLLISLKNIVSFYLNNFF